MFVSFADAIVGFPTFARIRGCSSRACHCFQGGVEEQRQLYGLSDRQKDEVKGPNDLPIWRIHLCCRCATKESRKPSTDIRERAEHERLALLESSENGPGDGTRQSKGVERIEEVSEKAMQLIRKSRSGADGVLRSQLVSVQVGCSKMDLPRK